MSLQIPEFIKEETRKRCKIVAFDQSIAGRFIQINPESFHLLYDTNKLSFALYVQIQDILIEFIKVGEFSHQLLEHMKLALLSEFNVQLMIAKAHREEYDKLILDLRNQRISQLAQKDGGLDQKTLTAFSTLSNASQLIVRGGISDDVINQAKSSTSFLVNNIMGNDMTLSTMSRMVLHDPTLYDHSASVAMISATIALQCMPTPMSKKESELVAQCGLFHDIGKTCIPSSILNKPGKFTDEEFAIMKSHAELGEKEIDKIVSSGARVDSIVARVAGEHHERFGGKGYPRGRKGRFEEDKVNGIHLYSRIVTVADVYSALLMKRVYKPAYEAQDAVKIMAGVAKDEYDPVVFKGFLVSVVKSLNLYQAKMHGKDKGRILSFDDDGKLNETRKLAI